MLSDNEHMNSHVNEIYIFELSIFVFRKIKKIFKIKSLITIQIISQ